MKEEEKTTKNETPQKPADKNKKKKPSDEFKRKYFDYYDDIKISDRQDW